MASQNFLPLRTDDGRVLGVVPLAAPLVASPSTTTATVEGNTVPVTWIVKGNDGVGMAVLPVTLKESRLDRWKQKFSTAIWMTDIVLAPKWLVLKDLVQNDMLLPQNDVMKFLATGVSLSALTSAVPAAPTANNAAVVWNTTAQFVGKQACTFLDVNWVALTGTSFPGMQPVSATIGTPNPSSISTYIKAYVFAGAPTVYGAGGVINTTLRFIKVRGDDPTPGAYDFPVTITSTNGKSVTVTLTLTVN